MIHGDVLSRKCIIHDHIHDSGVKRISADGINYRRNPELYVLVLSPFQGFTRGDPTPKEGEAYE